MSPAKLQPALLGGVAMGVLSALPIINLANCCCAWILFGGVLAAYLMQQNHPDPITVGDGAIVGLLAGVIGAVVWAVVSIPINAVLAPLQMQVFERAMENARDMPPEARSILESLGGGGAMGMGLVVGFVMMLVFGSLFGSFFGMIGGIFGSLMFRKDAPAPPPPPPLPPNPPPLGPGWG